MRDDGKLEQRIVELLADSQYAEHPLREALDGLFTRYQDHLTQIERLTSISDGYYSAMREHNQSLTERYSKHLRQLQKIVRISDHYQRMLRTMNEQLRTASTQDPLTGLANRRLMHDRITAEVASAARHQQPFSLVIADIDYFKKINDEHGHDVGDAALVAIAHTLEAGLRAYDVCARWGGEEFMILLPETAGPAALILAERLRAMVESLQDEALPAAIRASISVGVAEHRAGAEMEETFKRADEALYRAKKGGRNRVELAV